MPNEFHKASLMISYILRLLEVVEIEHFFARTLRQSQKDIFTPLILAAQSVQMPTKFRFASLYSSILSVTYLTRVSAVVDEVKSKHKKRLV